MGSEQKRAILAVVISGIILLSWQYFFPAPIGPVSPEGQPVKQTHITEADSLPSEPKIAKPVAASSIELKTDSYSYSIDSQLTILNSESVNFPLSLREVFSEDSNKVLFSFDGKFKQLNFQLEQTSETQVKISHPEGINGTASLQENGTLIFNLNSNRNFRYKFVFQQKEEELTGGQLKQFVYFGEDLGTVDVGSDDDGEESMKWFGFDFNFHLLAFVTEKTSKLFNVTEAGVFSVLNNAPTTQFQYKVVFAKKEYDRLVDLGDNLYQSIDFGFLSILATPILRGLQYFYTLIPNYGVAIIIITILMRLLTFPLQYKSYVSMKKMQEIQPEIAKVKEKYKEDPARMQQETMALFKKNGANPIGGCLPMILQMPIFFAFYRVLYNAVELVDAPFILWIHDLSAKDPYYVLPVLMGLAMFFHQKLTPTTSVDPVQKKIMMFVPLIFAFFMKDFPAGLNLYIFVSTVFAMFQQVIVYRKI